MSKADKMFEELDFTKITCEEGFFYHNRYSDKTILFDKFNKEISIYFFDDETVASLFPKELEATYLKCKELRWLDD